MAIPEKSSNTTAAHSISSITRRNFIRQLIATGLTLPMPTLAAADSSVIKKVIPSSQEAIPAIGMGTWLTFDVGDDIKRRLSRAQVLRRFFALGGSVIDSSPMYGSSEEVVGFCLNHLDTKEDAVFSATKVWTSSTSEGKAQIQDSHRLWDIKRFSLLQVHNLLNWREHLETLKNFKENGKVKYIGVTTSHSLRHRELEKILAEQPIDFVQLTYNIENRSAESRLLPLAREKGIAVIANRPFGGGALITRFQNRPLPKWAGDLGCQNWPQFLLKFIISHPALTCAIPATTQVRHMEENMSAMGGPLPDEKQRKQMLAYVAAL